MKRDIYDMPRILERNIRKVKNEKNLSERNKKLIFDFHRQGILENLSKHRITKYLRCLRIIGVAIKKDFDKASKEDMETYVQKLHEKDYTAHTRNMYKCVIKRFYKWLKGGDVKYPKEVDWIKTTIKRTERNLPGEGDLITEDEVKKLLNIAEKPRDKAFISVLYESGCRIGEICSLGIKDIKFDKYGALINVTGKTGSRRIRLVSSVPFLANWINSHPIKDDREAPVWICVGSKHHKRLLSYSGINVLLQRTFKRAGINKRFNPHLFRHSRATYLADHLTEFQMNQYFGWVQGSNMPSTYVHMSGKNVDNAILELNGIKSNKEETKESSLKPKKCPRCDTVNSFNDKFCSKCGGVLDIKTAMEIDSSVKTERKARGIGDKLIEMLMNDEKFKQILRDKAIDLGISQELIKNIQ